MAPLYITFGLISFIHPMLLCGEAVSLYDFNNPLVLKSLGISIFSILLVGILLWFQNRKKI